MKIKIDNDKLSAALKGLSKLARPEVVNLEFKGRYLTFRGAGESSSCMLRMELPTAVPESADITLDLNLIQGVTDKRKNIELEIKGNTLVVRSGSNYEATVLGIDGQPIDVVPKEVLNGTDGVTLKTSFMNGILKVLPLLELRPLLSTYSEVPIGIKATDAGTFIACFDFIQSAAITLPELKGNFEFMLPSVSQFSMLAKELSGHKYQMVITETTLYAWNDMFQTSLSLPQQEGEQLQIGDVLDLMSNLKTLKFKTLSLKSESIQQFLANSRAVYDKDSLFSLDAEGDKATIELKATVGDMKMSTKLLKPTSGVSFKCDLNFFASIVTKTKEKSIELKVNENMLRLKAGEINYLMSLV